MEIVVVFYAIYCPALLYCEKEVMKIQNVSQHVLRFKDFKCPSSKPILRSITLYLTHLSASHLHSLHRIKSDCHKINTSCMGTPPYLSLHYVQALCIAF